MKCCCSLRGPDTDFWHWVCVFYTPCRQRRVNIIYLQWAINEASADLLQQIWFEFYSRAVSFGAEKMQFVRGVVFCSVLWNGLRAAHTGDGQQSQKKQILSIHVVVMFSCYMLFKCSKKAINATSWICVLFIIASEWFCMLMSSMQ